MGADESFAFDEEPAAPGETKIMRSPVNGKYNSDRYLSRFPDAPQVGTIFDLDEYVKNVGGDLPVYGHRLYRNNAWANEYEWITRKEFCEIRNAVGSYLVKMIPEQGTHIGILSYNRMEWVYVQHACYAYGYIPVPIYDTFGWENMAYIINFSHLTHVFIVSTKVDLLLSNINSENCVLTDLIVFDDEEQPFDWSKVNYYKQKNPTINFHKFEDCLKFSDRYSFRPPKPETPAFIMFTSGTTGKPKGCIVSHANMIATGASVVAFAYPFRPDDSMISYLPLAHIFEAAMHVVAIKVLGRTGFYSGSLKRLSDDMTVMKPTAMIGVSRVFERIQDGIKAKLNNMNIFARFAFNTAFAIKSLALKLRIAHIPGIDMIFKPVRQAVGGEMRFFVAGGSAISEELQHFIRIAFNVPFLIGYGLTETTGPVCVSASTDFIDGHQGPPMGCCEVKLRDVPELGYFTQNKEGELLTRGANVIPGYYKNDEEYALNFEEGGWFKTGDIFRYTDTHQLTIIGRKKEIVKLSQGEYVSLSKLTQIYGEVQGVKQIYVHAGLTARFLTAIVVVSPNSRPSEVDLLQKFEEKAKEYNLNGFEKIKSLYITTEDFTPDNKLMTPSLKQCRKAIAEKYKVELERLEKQ